MTDGRIIRMGKLRQELDNSLHKPNSDLEYGQRSRPSAFERPREGERTGHPTGVHIGWENLTTNTSKTKPWVKEEHHIISKRGIPAMYQKKHFY